jgi:hypothetical protein
MFENKQAEQSAVDIQVFGGNGLPDIRRTLDGCGVRDADEDE